MKFLKKYWFIILIIIITILRVSISYKLPTFFVGNLRVDDRLSIEYMETLSDGKYLGDYNDKTLVKGYFYSLIMSLGYKTSISYSVILTTLYILAVIYCTLSLKTIIKNKYILLIIYVFLLFNPVSYSSELFQRFYRCSLSLQLILFFLGSLIRILVDDKNKIINYIIFGIIISIMFLTREDNIWVYMVLMLLMVYKLYKKKSFKVVLINAIPIIILIFSLNIISLINYKYYGIYTYNELQKSEFKNTYKKILQIEDNEKLHQVSIPKSTFYKLADNLNYKWFNRDFVASKYTKELNEVREIYNGNIVWAVRNWFINVKHFKNGKESEEFYKELGEEIDRLFKEGILEKEFIMPSIFLNVPTKEELIEYPKDIIKTIFYTTSYKNVKTFSEKDIISLDATQNDIYHKGYYVKYLDYHNAENMIEENIWYIEIIRVIYKWFTIIFSVLSLLIYIKNIKVKDKLNVILHFIVIVYTIIICGVAYTNTTAYAAIRYRYLGSIYLLQSLFIIFNIWRFYKKILND